MPDTFFIEVMLHKKMAMILRAKAYSLLIIAAFVTTGCNNAVFDNFDTAGRSTVEEVYVPPITAYIFGEAMPAKLPRKCNTETCDWTTAERFEAADEMVAAIFDNQYGTSNYFTKQFMVATRAYINDLQIVYVKTDSTVTSTSLYDDVNSQTYTLSDPTGTEDKGTFHHPEGRIRLVFTGSFECDEGDGIVAGCATVNRVDTIQTPQNGLIVINANNLSLRMISETMAHELGHFFGLNHTFSSIPTDGCDTITQNTTKYIMDYSSDAILFQACEIAHAKTILEASPFSIGYFENVPVDDNPVLLSINSDETFDSTEQKIEVIRGDWEGKRTIGTPPDLNAPKLDIPYMP